MQPLVKADVHPCNYSHDMHELRTASISLLALSGKHTLFWGHAEEYQRTTY